MKTHARKHDAGLWIDHREAILVVLYGIEAETQHIHSHAEKQLRRLGEPDHGHFEAHQVPADDTQQREYDSALAHYYDNIIAHLHHVGSLLILGPGEAKGEFRKRFEAIPDHPTDIHVQPADKLSEAQVVEMVRHHFHREAPRM